MHEFTFEMITEFCVRYLAFSPRPILSCSTLLSLLGSMMRREGCAHHSDVRLPGQDLSQARHSDHWVSLGSESVIFQAPATLIMLRGKHFFNLSKL